MRHLGHAVAFAVLLAEVLFKHHTAELHVVLPDDFRQQVIFAELHHRAVRLYETEPEHEETVVDVVLHALAVGLGPHGTALAYE